jgi:hypothetical protein
MLVLTLQPLASLTSATSFWIQSESISSLQPLLVSLVRCKSAQSPRMSAFASDLSLGRFWKNPPIGCNGIQGVQNEPIHAKIGQRRSRRFHLNKPSLESYPRSFKTQCRTISTAIALDKGSSPTTSTFLPGRAPNSILVSGPLTLIIIVSSRPRKRGGEDGCTFCISAHSRRAYNQSPPRPLSLFFPNTITETHRDCLLISYRQSGPTSSALKDHVQSRLRYNIIQCIPRK